MSIHTVCPKGHKLKLKNKYAGLLGRCPMCGSPVRVPDLNPSTAGSSLSAQSLLMAGPPVEADSLPPKTDEVAKVCAHCSANVPRDMFVCPNCGTNVETMDD